MLMLDRLNKKQTSKIPIWFMRQAGRYLPEYRKLRKECIDRGMSFLDMCYSSDIASEITLQPLRRFNLDAGIIFSDILVIPDLIGWRISFHDGTGPVCNRFTSESDMQYMIPEMIYDKLDFIKNSISKVKKQLNENQAMIGFSGSPFTILTYMLEGSSSRTFENTFKMIYQNPILFQKLISALSNAIIPYLVAQIESGCDIIQLFDSHAGILNCELYNKYIIVPNQNIVNAIKAKFKDIKIIGFPRNSSYKYKDFAENVDCDAIQIDNSMPNSFFSNINPVIQGNLDNNLLCFGNIAQIELEVSRIIKDFKNNYLIFNLSHGIIKHTPIENVEAMIQFIKK